MALALRHIEIRGARTHNLHGVDADIPHGRITVVTGVSGSGKSSLALDTLYAEGQRRFVESMSAYARQYLARLARPPLERLDFVPPAIAIGQTSRPRSPRATVGTMSQLTDLMQLLWGAASQPFCPEGHGPIKRAAASSARNTLVDNFSGRRATIAAVVASDYDRNRALRSDGYHRVLADGEIHELGETATGTLRVVIDRLVVKDNNRLAESLATALLVCDGRAEVYVEGQPQPVSFVESLACDRCGFEVPPRQARLFSASSALGACPECEGFGRTATIDRDKVVPDPTRTLLQDAVAPWSTPSRASNKEAYHALAKRRGLRLTVPWQSLTPSEQTLVWSGDPKTGFDGVVGFFERLQRKRYKMSARILIARYRGWDPCATCGGTRLVPTALAYEVDGHSIAAALRRPIVDLRRWSAGLELDPGLHRLRDQLTRRLEILEQVGLGYLEPAREGRTLSAGEARRVHLSSALGAGVTGTLYVLDEPSIGLHPRDTARLTALLRRLADKGNTVVIVEHDTDVIRAADRVIELGPGAGRKGGQVVFAGTPKGLARRRTPTGRALKGPGHPIDLEPFAAARGELKIQGARFRTLSSVNCSIPIGKLTCITGVSGSGKSTLMFDVLAWGAKRTVQGASDHQQRYDGIEGTKLLTGVHIVDTSPLARSVRSIPATYIDAWTSIRKVLAEGPDARRLGLTAREFSFNSGGGRCETCKGLGTVTVDMQFLADVVVTCDDCDGRRFSSRVLSAKWSGKSVDEVLAMSVDEATSSFGAHPTVVRRLRPLQDVGLGYLGLGQSTSTLSGGEAQRLKLASHLASKKTAGQLLLLDEPTTGLHLEDVQHLLRSLAALINRGATVVIVEHHCEVIRHAHHIIDLGPEGGVKGGEVIVEGSLFDLLGAETSHTAAALIEYLGSSEADRPTS